MQKAVVAGIPFISGVGAPSSLAVDTALEFGQTLVGFLGPHGFNIYAGAERVELEA
jgi:FdhD protein